jgi:hypothetical protein
MRLLFTCLAAFIYTQIFAQNPDSLRISAPDTLGQGATLSKANKMAKIGVVTPDTSIIPIPKKQGLARRFFSKNYPNPRTAALLSFIIPGAGQAYNKKWWKIPIVWGVLGGIAYGTFDTQKTYHELRDAYKTIVNGGKPEAPYDGFDATRLRSYRDTYRGYTEKWYLALGVTYLLGVTDAFVDAHLSRFDVSDNLSLRLKPSFETTTGLPVFGLGFALSLTKPKVTFPLTFSYSNP